MQAPRFSEENFPKNLKLVDRITELAKKKNVTASQLTLAWLLAQGDDIFPVSKVPSIAMQVGKHECLALTHAISFLRRFPARPTYRVSRRT